jgi:type I restriction-modification system DNA methylase subunit
MERRNEIEILDEMFDFEEEFDQQEKEDGQYFTPDDVAQLMAKKSLNFPENRIWVDPCSGVGNLSFWLIKS